MKSFNEITNLKYQDYELTDIMYKKILNDIYFFIKENTDEIKKSNRIDLQFNNFKISLDKIIQIINKYKIKTPSDNFNNKTIAITYYGDPYITFNLCLEAIKTKTRIILLIEDKNLILNLFFVNLINEVLQEHNIYNLISICNVVNREEIAKNCSKFTKLICIGNELEYFYHYKDLKNTLL